MKIEISSLSMYMSFIYCSGDQSMSDKPLQTLVAYKQVLTITRSSVGWLGSAEWLLLGVSCSCRQMATEMDAILTWAGRPR